MKRPRLLGPLIALVLAAAPLAAQEPGRGEDNVPPAQRPPAGMCRIWLDNVPASQQPAPTDCPTAVRNRPPNGRVIFGDEPRGGGRGGPRPKKLRPPGADRQGWGVAGDGRRAGRARGDYADRGARGDAEDDADWYDARDERDDRFDRDDRDARDRYGRFFRPGSDVCDDRNRDGRCDDAQGDGDRCVDRDRDGLCDEDYGVRGSGADYVPGFWPDYDPRYGLRYDPRGGRGVADDHAYGGALDGYADEGAGGRRLPSMRAGAAARRGQLGGEVARWLGAREVTSRVLDANRDGTPERVTWLTARGEVIQVWYDRDRDGVADRVELYENGRRVRVIGQ